ncbi:uncharacterized protein CLUP02_14072 [Colletotrichum lupini]|uniref:Uncharacterized protein n=1 Tax=Colletotrichum lupini TaxID=145971 RepID=A0A9Q8T5F8_9PEZI|nr:uncharacterized protein CLUP02_14072 [Colletotrichum lupini]UQC88547.1 hypothetical protein CLUP02_14072 [Colletotrichum lupini]
MANFGEDPPLTFVFSLFEKGVEDPPPNKLDKSRHEARATSVHAGYRTGSLPGAPLRTGGIVMEPREFPMVAQMVAQHHQHPPDRPPEFRVLWMQPSNC